MFSATFPAIKKHSDLNIISFYSCRHIYIILWRQRYKNFFRRLKFPEIFLVSTYFPAAERWLFFMNGTQVFPTKKSCSHQNPIILTIARAGLLCPKVCKIALSATKRHKKPENHLVNKRKTGIFAHPSRQTSSLTS